MRRRREMVHRVSAHSGFCMFWMTRANRDLSLHFVVYLASFGFAGAGSEMGKSSRHSVETRRRILRKKTPLTLQNRKKLTCRSTRHASSNTRTRARRLWQTRRLPNPCDTRDTYIHSTIHSPIPALADDHTHTRHGTTETPSQDPPTTPNRRHELKTVSERLTFRGTLHRRLGSLVAAWVTSHRCEPPSPQERAHVAVQTRQIAAAAVSIPASGTPIEDSATGVVLAHPALCEFCWMWMRWTGLGISVLTGWRALLLLDACSRTRSGDFELFATDSDDVLALEQLLGDERGQATKQVAAAINNDRLLKHHFSSRK